jgi:hypothetical protein
VFGLSPTDISVRPSSGTCAIIRAPTLHFIWVGPLGWWDPWNGTEPRGIRLHYMMWRRAVVAAARRLMATESIDVVHHVGWSTVSAPPLLWQIGKPFVWGPVGGGQVLPWRFLPSGGRSVVPELLRTLRIGVLPWTPSLRSAVSRADLVLAINRETAAVLRKAGARHVPLLPDTGIPAALPDRHLGRSLRTLEGPCYLPQGSQGLRDTARKVTYRRMGSPSGVGATVRAKPRPL